MKIALIGYGKMGKVIEKLALTKGHEVALRISRHNLQDLNLEKIQYADVAIDFSLPETAFNNIAFCLENNIPIVSGTTGWLEKMDEARALCSKHQGAFFYASNFSIGVNILFALNRFLASMMKGQPQYDVSIEEIHHVQKLDHPSGTAITLAKGILAHSNRKGSWEARLEKGDRVGNEAAVVSEKLIITSKRGGSVPGTHLIKWSSAIDKIEIGHVAHSREGFAAGALAAAEWIIGKEGSFGMEDMLGF